MLNKGFAVTNQPHNFTNIFFVTSSLLFDWLQLLSSWKKHFGMTIDLPIIDKDYLEDDEIIINLSTSIMVHIGVKC